MTDELTHTADGHVQMVNIGDKPKSKRRAVANGEITLQPSTIKAVRNETIEKGDVLTTARIGAIQAVKRTWDTVPLCHQIPITNIEVEFDLMDDRIGLTVAVETIGQTGCEIEAINGVSTGLTVVLDMVKSAEKTADGTYQETALNDITVIEKRVEPMGDTDKDP